MAPLVIVPIGASARSPRGLLSLIRCWEEWASRRRGPELGLGLTLAEGIWGWGEGLNRSWNESPAGPSGAG